MSSLTSLFKNILQETHPLILSLRTLKTRCICVLPQALLQIPLLVLKAFPHGDLSFIPIVLASLSTSISFRPSRGKRNIKLGTFVKRHAPLNLHPMRNKAKSFIIKRVQKEAHKVELSCPQSGQTISRGSCLW